MTAVPPGHETDPIRRAIIAAMNRLLAGSPHRSNGRLNVSQLAIEAGVKRWHLTHQHPDLKDLFQAKAATQDSRRATHLRSADAFEDLRRKHAELQEHCRFLEARLQTYATVLNLLAMENAALHSKDTEAGKVRFLPPPAAAGLPPSSRRPPRGLLDTDPAPSACASRPAPSSPRRRAARSGSGPAPDPPAGTAAQR